ncbi:MAG: hypothetical protein Q8M16_11580 [Pirellulaceae bacterium]|nr:hypothetical protein [Pirellulaceae bacterium]
MSVVVIFNSNNGSVNNGKIDAGGGEVLDRIQHLHARLVLVPGLAGTVTTALELTVARDASQGTGADSLALKYHAGTGGRAERNVFPLDVMMIDDVRAGQVSLMGKIVCRDAYILDHKTDFIDEEQTQSVTFRANRFSIFNAIDGASLPASPVIVPGFNDEDDAD